MYSNDSPLPTRPLKVTTLSVLILIMCWCAPSGRAQSGMQPQRGFTRTSSYALSEIENINMSNGNVMFNIPLVSLPPGRGGSSGATVALHYNSKIFDPTAVVTPSGAGFTVRTFLAPSENGNWRYGIGYSLEVIDRGTDYYYPYGGGPAYECPTSPQGAAEITKVRVRLPDGSVRDFRPSGEYNNDYDHPNFFSVDPEGRRHFCSCPSNVCSTPAAWTLSSTSPSYETRTYYSADSSYQKLTISFGPAVGGGLRPRYWTLSTPDGTRVSNDPTLAPNGGNRIIDRNNNYTDILSATSNGNPATRVVDQLGRSIIIEEGPSNQDYVRATGVGGEPLVWTIQWKTIYVNKTYLAGDSTYTQNLNQSFRVIDTITLPSQLGSQSYSFEYNGSATSASPSVGWGEVSKITLASGAYATYAYKLDNISSADSWSVLQNVPTRKELHYEQEYDGASTSVVEPWTYDYSFYVRKPSAYYSTLTAPDGGTSSEAFIVNDNHYDHGLPKSTARPDGTLVERIWRPNIVPSAYGTEMNPYVKTEFITIPGGQTAIKDYSYDKNGNITQTREYDWVNHADIYGGPSGTLAIPPGAPLRRVTTTTYYNATPDASNSTTNDPDSYDKATAPLLRNAPASTETGDGSQTLGRGEFFYDNASTTGNLTQQKSWSSTKGVYSNPLSPSNSISISHEYDAYHNRILSTDASGSQTKFTYGPVSGFTDLYPTQVISAFGTNIQLTQTLEYDFNTGLVTRATDVDNNVSNESDYDVFGRLREIRAAANIPSVKTVTRVEYSAVDRRIITRSDLNVPYDGKLVTIQHYDQLGRVRLSRQLEDAAAQSATDETTGIKVQTRYMFSGSNSYRLVSNPYRASLSSAAGLEPSMGWTRSKSDSLGRLIEVQTFGGAVLPGPWGSNAIPTGAVTTAYNAEFTTVTDQSLRVRRSRVDGLGRLIRVDEPNATSGNLDVNGSPVQSTGYEYDAQGNLRHVTQGEQQRFFMYDSLSRLIRASNPEQQDKTSLAITDPITGHGQWSVKYNYDDNGNLVQKIDPRGVVTDFGYDALNRNLSVVYANDPANTPAITRAYDTTSSYGKGRLRSTLTSGATGSLTTIDAYDALGRPKGSTQTLGSQPYTLLYTYDLAGHVKTIIYPSGNSVTNNYDLAGRTNSFTGNLGEGGPQQRNYATNISYSPFGGLSQEQLGTTTPIYDKLFYNSRGQLAEIREGLTPNNSSWQLGAIINHYSNGYGCWGASCNAPDNNGNLMRQEHWTQDGNDNVQAVFTQQYEYDQLNRLKRAYDGTTWQQAYTYDRYGNRSINGGATWGQNINNMQAAVVANTITNRLYAPGETEANHPLMNYDAAGNQTKDYYSDPVIDYDRTYDAENRMVSATKTSNQTSAYSYDGDGRRVVRNENGVVTWQIYGLGGELLAEYAANTSYLTPQKEYGYRNGQLLITVESGATGAAAPSSLVATPPTSGANITLGWTAATGATNYRVERKAAAGSFALVGTTTSTSLIDSTAASGNAYLYKVCAADTQGNCTSAYSNFALGASVTFPTDASIKTFSEDSLNATSIKAAHITELRSAVNAVRTLAGLSAATWAYPNVATGNTIHVEDVRELRTKLGEALNLLGIQTPTYTDSTIKGFVEDPLNATTIKAAHIRELRQRAASGIGGNGGSGGLQPQIRWLVSDQVGTPRIVLAESGSLANVSRHDYLPFGEELFAGTGGRTPALGYTNSDAVRQKFTSYERDNETGLDFAKARYFSSVQGRFATVDPVMGSAQPGLPQSWNRYTYTINNPLKYVDPSGLIWGMKKTGDNTEYMWFEGDTVGEGYDTVTNFYVEGMINGNQVGLTLNPNGPRSFWTQLALDLDPGLAVTTNNSDYFVKGYQIGETRAQFGERSRTGAVDRMQNQAFDVGLTLAGIRGIGILNRSAAGAALEGIATPYGRALQAMSPEALAAREAVENGATLYRGGVLGRSAGPEGQFWSMENPLNSGYANRYGIPSGNRGFDFIEYGKLNPGSPFVTRPAPGGSAGIETVINPNTVRLSGFHMP